MGNKLYNEDSVQNIANAIRAVNGSSDTYKIGEMANAISSISTGLDWSELNYDTTGADHGTPKEIINAFNYAIDLKDNFDPGAAIENEYLNDLKLFFWPNVDITGYYTYNSMFAGSRLWHCPPLTIGIDNVSTVVSTTNMFKNTLIENSEITPVTGNKLSLSYTYENCLNLKSAKINGAIGEMSATFINCRNLTDVTIGDTSAVESFRYVFVECYKLVNAPAMDTSASQSFQEMFRACISLTTVPLYDMSTATVTESMFHTCSALVNAPAFNMGNITNSNWMYHDCTSLENVPVYDFGSITTLTGMFNNCTALTDTSLDNILQSCISAVSYTGTKSLAQLGINNSYDSRITSLPHYNDFINAGWIIR